jgi:apolipoprotein N-acyltransferase
VSHVPYALLGSLLMAAATPPFGVWPLGLVAWVPLAHLASSGRAVRAGLLGWLQGTLLQLMVLSALPAALRHTSGASLVGSFAAALLWALWEGGRVGLVAVLAARAAANGWPLSVAFPAGLVAGELAYPMFFPWRSCLFFQNVPALLQGAEIGGTLLLTLLVGVVDASVASAMRHWGRGRLVWRDAVVVPACLLGSAAVWGRARIREVEAQTAGAPALRVGMVQGDVRAVGQDYPDSALRYRTASVPLARDQGLDLLIWPEAAIPEPTPEPELTSVLRERVFRPAGGEPPIEVPLLAGVMVRRARETAFPAVDHPLGRWRDPEPVFNSAVLAFPGGAIASTYDKRALVAFGEYLPAEDDFPWLRQWMPRAGRLTAGRSSLPIRLGERRLQVLICLEDILGEEVRSDVVSGNPELLVSLASDTWFGASRVPWLHLGLAKLRAIEHRRFLVRASNTGVSAIVRPTGELDVELLPDRPGAAAATIHWMSVRTPYTRFGDAPFWSVAAMAVLGAFARRARRPMISFAEVPARSLRTSATETGPSTHVAPTHFVD